LTFINLPNRPNLLTIVGDGPDRQRLENIAHQLAISDKVHFLGRLPSNLDVWREMARSKVAIQPSSREGFGLFPLEAMALGLPVIYCKSSESAISALVRDRVEGICAEANPQSLAQAIEELLTDNYLREQYSKNAIQRSQDYDWMNIAEKMETLFYKSLRNC
jgi:glycosyltransferase involved in cell wall biosynthesis